MNLKTILLLSILFSVPLLSMAQLPDLSLRGGLNFSTTGGSQAINSRLKTGFHVGIYGTLPITEVFSLESGLSYSLKGAVINNVLSKDAYNLHYLDLPVLARVGVYENIYLLAGPQISYLMASVFSVESQGIKIRESSTDGYRRIDLGVHLGATYDLQNQFMVGVGYDWGLLTLDKTGESKTFNRLIKLSLIYQMD